jgi:hypothetical protein
MGALEAAQLGLEIIGLERQLMKPISLEKRLELTNKIEKLKNKMLEEEMKP